MNYQKLINISLGFVISLLLSVSLIDGKKITLTYSVPVDCTVDTMQLFTFSGIGFKPYQLVTKVGNAFTFELEGGKSAFYFVGPDQTMLKSVILGEEKQVVMESKCDDYKMANVKKSKVNQEYAAYLQTRNDLSKQSMTIVNAYRQTTPDDIDTRKGLDADLMKIDAARLAETKKYKSDFVNKIAALFAYQSYQNNKGDYEVEMEYFADHFFSQVDLSDKIYDQMSVVYEAFGNYTSVLSQANMLKEDHEAKLLSALSKIDDKGQAYKYALGAVVNTLYRTKHSNMPAFATIYVGKYYRESECGQNV